MSRVRAVAWGGLFNVRDLGGLPTSDGRTSECGRVFRSATLSMATREGWEVVCGAGVRTIVSLLNDDEVQAMGAAGEVWPAGRIDHVRVPLDAVEDVPLWDQIATEGVDGTPLYYALFLDRHPERAAAAVRAVAHAEPGAVLFHCGAGRDRTGLIHTAQVATQLAGRSKDSKERSCCGPARLKALDRADRSSMSESEVGCTFFRSRLHLPYTDRRHLSPR